MSVGTIVHTYFFDTKDGVTVRDRFGISFNLDSEAIEHSIKLAEGMRLKGPIKEADYGYASSTTRDAKFTWN